MLYRDVHVTYNNRYFADTKTIVSSNEACRATLACLETSTCLIYTLKYFLSYSLFRVFYVDYFALLVTKRAISAKIFRQLIFLSGLRGQTMTGKRGQRDAPGKCKNLSKISYRTDVTIKSSAEGKQSAVA